MKNRDALCGHYLPCEVECKTETLLNLTTTRNKQETRNEVKCHQRREVINKVQSRFIINLERT